MSNYVILGAGDSVLCMLFEMLHQLHHKEIKVPVVKNVSSPESRIPFETSLVSALEMSADNWTPKVGDQYLLGVVNPKIRRHVYEYFSERFQLVPTSFPVLGASPLGVASTVTLNQGVVINPGCTVAGHTLLDDHAFINRAVNIGHHSRIGKFCSVNPGVTICGHCDIGDGSTIGAGATVLNTVSVGANSVIGAGSVVTKDIPDNVVAYGSPAKVIRELP